ncbi:aromatic-ring-hydroxylating dioxygenase subunit beta [Pseudomonas asiatica]|jgi:3-phenylpropionate/cinnamic acid dioxygenase small subunit|uniref:Benzene 1,2-dioxygenase subunit beta n=6 Tax=Pseudomonas putida group TaxID=136845 RepID=BNZB_PSEPU|nr:MULTISPECIES: aromatic-ring-hydroxylating dioxygenase subunit beta [Pseudomonas]A5W4F1.1 RecName: Full=Benzene 1,2-dioxygenase subunit beta; AltName: Full=Benzene 1,2-dioxygenase P2 subunit; AltName: Full=Toluene 2,3-dioxygenase subunit beta [Pseudomonas putida F1]P0C619.1 RecName: Full=Benzene 1,2-dioxygenase subunit beta; AltName: Full=Benzene 1,2-dioxygenase P2 subunit; AltName: Full=Toluene 2,3-dioxygenase subunit beta [Pseudomonas putida]3EN1_B Chain B, Benzene 1,2-dioxygenase subunit be
MIDSANRADVFLRKPAPVAPELQHEVEQFYYWEAKLLNDRRFEEWFALLAEDIHYFMPIRTTRIMRDSRLEYSGSREYAHFDDDATMMKGRLRKITSDVSWSENPASRTRHLVSNVMIVGAEAEGEYEISSAFIVYRNRLERQLDIFAGERRDTLRRNTSEAGFEIVNRTILIDQSTILANNLSFFF